MSLYPIVNHLLKPNGRLFHKHGSATTGLRIWHQVKIPGKWMSLCTVYTRLLVDSSISRSVIFGENQWLEYKSNLKNELNEKENRI